MRCLPLVLLALLVSSVQGLTLDRPRLGCNSLEVQLRLSDSEWSSSSSVAIRLDRVSIGGLKNENIHSRIYSTKGDSRDILGPGAFSLRLVLPQHLERGEHRITAELRTQQDGIDASAALQVPWSQDCSSSDALDLRQPTQSRRSNGEPKRDRLSGGEIASITTAVLCTGISAACLVLFWTYLRRRPVKAAADAEAVLSDTDDTLMPGPRSLTDLFKDFPVPDSLSRNRVASSTTSIDDDQDVRLPCRPALSHAKSARLPRCTPLLYRDDKLSRSAVSVPTNLNVALPPASAAPSFSYSETIVAGSVPESRLHVSELKRRPGSFKIPRVSVPLYLEDAGSNGHQDPMSTAGEPLDKVAWT